MKIIHKSDDIKRYIQETILTHLKLDNPISHVYLTQYEYMSLITELEISAMSNEDLNKLFNTNAVWHVVDYA